MIKCDRRLYMNYLSGIKTTDKDSINMLFLTFEAIGKNEEVVLTLQGKDFSKIINKEEILL